jgi:hypothetical protein
MPRSINSIDCRYQCCGIDDHAPRGYNRPGFNSLLTKGRLVMRSKGTTLVLFLTGLSAYAQSNQGTITGTISDPSSPW